MDPSILFHEWTSANSIGLNATPLDSDGIHPPQRETDMTSVRIHFTTRLLVTPMESRFDDRDLVECIGHLCACQPIISSLSSGIERSDRRQTLLPHVMPGGVLGSIFAGFVSLASPNPYPIIVYSVANN